MILNHITQSRHIKICRLHQRAAKVTAMGDMDVSNSARVSVQAGPDSPLFQQRDGVPVQCGTASIQWVRCPGLKGMCFQQRDIESRLLDGHRNGKGEPRQPPAQNQHL